HCLAVINGQSASVESANNQLALCEASQDHPLNLLVAELAATEGEAVAIAGEEGDDMFTADTADIGIDLVDHIIFHDGFLQYGRPGGRVALTRDGVDVASVAGEKAVGDGHLHRLTLRLEHGDGVGLVSVIPDQ